MIRDQRSFAALQQQAQMDRHTAHVQWGTCSGVCSPAGARGAIEPETPSPWHADPLEAGRAGHGDYIDRAEEVLEYHSDREGAARRGRY